jgi:LacI family transcriptional regulator
MRRTRKIAMVGGEWRRLDARLLGGGLNYASGHASLDVVIRPFSKTIPVGRLAAGIERWGADGIYGTLLDDELQGLKAALKHPIPIVTNVSSGEYAGVVHVFGDAQLVLEMAVEHLRHLGLKEFGLLWTDPPPKEDNRWLTSFKKLTGRHGSVLLLPVPEAQLLDPDRTTLPIPERLATWLRELPKPCGVLSTCMGSGKFLIESCAQLGLQVPREIAIVGGDDADVCLSCTPTLTSIIPSMELVGSESVRILLSLLDGIAPATPNIRIRALDLVARQSTGQHPRMICDVDGALEYIQANATKGLSVPQLVRATQRSSESMFYQVFQKTTGKTPAQAIRDRQLEEVRRLLATTQIPVGVVSSMAGFNSQTAMGRLFLQVEGVTPMEYRKREQKG